MYDTEVVLDKMFEMIEVDWEPSGWSNAKAINAWIANDKREEQQRQTQYEASDRNQRRRLKQGSQSVEHVVCVNTHTQNIQCCVYVCVTYCE